jgi:hypothetical protein
VGPTAALRSPLGTECASTLSALSGAPMTDPKGYAKTLAMPAGFDAPPPAPIRRRHYSRDHPRRPRRRRVRHQRESRPDPRDPRRHVADRSGHRGGGTTSTWSGTSASSGIFRHQLGITWQWRRPSLDVASRPGARLHTVWRRVRQRPMAARALIVHVQLMVPGSARLEDTNPLEGSSTSETATLGTAHHLRLDSAGERRPQDMAAYPAPG